jgi:uncharacterized protein YceH (UPF0502 family)
MPHPTLTPLQCRILAVLVEKQLTVPDTYPLSLNALRAGCNQKNARDPVMNATELEIASALDGLRTLSLVIESSGSRALRYEQNLRRVLDVAGAAVPLLATLMLRGPQTAAELRLNTERMQRFADASSVEAFLRELAGHAAGPLVVELDRRPGERERRWRHRLVPDDTGSATRASESPAAATAAATRQSSGAGHADGARDPGDPRHGGQTAAGAAGGLAALEARLAALESRVAALERRPDDGAPGDGARDDDTRNDATRDDAARDDGDLGR